MDIHFKDENFYDIKRQDGLFYVTLQAIHEGSANEGTDIKFILDTGAYMTVISRGTAIQCGFDRLPKKYVTLFGFSGGITADFVRIPGLRVLDKLYTDVPVMIPHDLYRVHPKTGEKKQMAEVLGLNILGYYDFYVDSTNGRLHLKETLVPSFYNDNLKSGQIFTIED
jgi:hypothetical protein